MKRSSVCHEFDSVIDVNLIERKMRMIHGEGEDENTQKSARSAEADSSSSSEEDSDADLLDKKLKLLQGRLESDLLSADPPLDDDNSSSAEEADLNLMDKKFGLLKGGPCLVKLPMSQVEEKLKSMQNNSKMDGKQKSESPASSGSDIEGEDLMLQKLTAAGISHLSAQVGVRIYII